MDSRLSGHWPLVHTLGSSCILRRRDIRRRFGAVDRTGSHWRPVDGNLRVEAPAVAILGSGLPRHIRRLLIFAKANKARVPEVIGSGVALHAFVE